MHKDNISLYQHSHVFSETNLLAERRTFQVVLLTLTMMIVEIVAGYVFHSMALLADGWHMSTHAFALGISLLAFILARRHAHDRSYVFGTWKIEVLGGFTSGLLLGVVSLAMGYVSVERLIQPVPIQYNQALLVTVLGLIVNLLSAIMLKGSGHEHAHHHHDHPHDDHHDHEGHHDHEDLHGQERKSQPAEKENLNLRAAYLHVIADALTSVLAILALTGAKFFGWVWLDPLMGLVGAFLILRWTYSLLKDTGTILVDRESNDALSEGVRATMESDGDVKISDLHLWKVGMNKYACVMSLIATHPKELSCYKDQLKGFTEIVHATIEVAPCENHHPHP